MLRDAAPTPLTEREIYGGYCEGHVVLGGGTLVERRTSFALLGPDEEASRLDRLNEICANTWFASAPLITWPCCMTQRSICGSASALPRMACSSTRRLSSRGRSTRCLTRPRFRP